MSSSFILSIFKYTTELQNFLFFDADLNMSKKIFELDDGKFNSGRITSATAERSLQLITDYCKKKIYE